MEKQPGDNVIDLVWVFKVKECPDGTVDKLKACLVANSSCQIEGIDYYDTFSMVVKAVSKCFVLTLAITNGWEPMQIDINNAFLNGSLSKRILMHHPAGFVDWQFTECVCLLWKAMYGLKQLSRVWYR